MARTVTAQSLDVALIGLGAIAEPHLAAYQTLAKVRVCAAVEPREARCAEVSARYGLRAFSTCEELLEKSRPQVACVLTPPATHRRLTELCASSGVHVLCEKPMAVTLEDAAMMSHACERAGVQFFYGSSYRYLAALTTAKELIRAGAIGKVRLIVEHAIGGAGAAKYQPLSPAHYPEGGPGGGGWGLVDHGIHMLDIFPWLCDSYVSAVIGRGDRTGSEPRPEFAMLTLGSGASCFLLYDGSTWPAELPPEGVFSATPRWADGRGWVGEGGYWDTAPGTIRIYGTEGSLRLFHYANKLYLSEGGRQREVPLAGAPAPAHFGRQLQHFWHSLAADLPPPISAADGIRALQALLAVYHSEAEGSWQSLPAQ